LIELELDFSQEDVEFADRTKLNELVSEAVIHTRELVESFRLGNVIKNGLNVAIIGKPNAGKSTLLNALLNEDRAIVSDIPGTTRDTIEEVINIDGILFRLIDTAGIRSHTADVIESAGIAKSLQKMRQADLVIYLFDVKEMAAEELQRVALDLQQQQLQFLLVGNKVDPEKLHEAHQKFASNGSLLFISAKHGYQLDTMKQRMVGLVLQDQINTENVIVTNARHYHALKEVLQSLEEIQIGLESQLPGDLLALEIRRCLQYLGEITGEITNDDQLDYIFSKFCIGK
jgi:tRNA modification GTPase